MTICCQSGCRTVKYVFFVAVIKFRVMQIYFFCELFPNQYHVKLCEYVSFFVFLK